MQRNPLPASRYELPDGRSFVTASRFATGASFPRHVAGAFGAGAALVVDALTERKKLVVAITSDDDAASRLLRDVSFFAPGARLAVLTTPDATPYAEVHTDHRATQLRLATLDRLVEGAVDVVVVTAAALARRLPPPALVKDARVRIRAFETLERDELVRRLVRAGYARTPIVEDPATLAVRGALVDLWPTGAKNPVRVELDGDVVAAIKSFDPDSQKTLAELEEVVAPLARNAPEEDAITARAREALRHLCDEADMPSVKARVFVDEVTSGRLFLGGDGYVPAFTPLVSPFDHFSGDAIYVMTDPPEVARALRAELERAELDRDARRDVPTFPLDALYVEEAEIALALEQRDPIRLHRTPTLGDPGAYAGMDRLGVTDVDPPTLHTFDQGDLVRDLGEARKRDASAALAPAALHLGAFSEAGLSTVIVARTETQAERVFELLSHKGLSIEKVTPPPAGILRARARGQGFAQGSVSVTVGDLASGLVAPLERLALVTEENIFGVRSEKRPAEGARAKTKQKAFLEDLKALSVGDFVVHVEHGVGRYLGLLHREVHGAKVDFVAVEYAGGDKLYLPVYRLHQMQKFVGGDGNPKLDRLGGQTFAKTKARTQGEVRKMADELLRTFAERRAIVRKPMPPPSDAFRAFEATFPFEETADQARAIAEVDRDLELPSPMDRLVCGDVGFGKTEIAMRAAFRVASEGKQVAVLCPTTVLAQQHYLSFRARMDSFPIIVKPLSRFTSKKEQSEVLLGLREGKIDVVIGTHRLLSKDVHFKDLGLLVVDEEQRFGVTHKERIKELKRAVDILTLTATPIPRTLNLAVAGLRDMSVITTPPVDRRAIRTMVVGQSPEVIREAVVRELSRGGQVFYVYNRVEGLYERAARLQELVPTARICVGHGQLGEAVLEKTMIDFVDGKYDILCATAIVESGLDIPRANTIVIDRADMFGLSQLYQLRGRVGRSTERAYCYLVTPPQSALTDEARARIEALEQHTELGSGFRIAALDLELRGAGDVLGAEQSGTIASVGFELFCQMLEEAVAVLRGEPIDQGVDTELSVDEDALLPEAYIEDVGVRLTLYKRLSGASSPGEVEDLTTEMEDRFGKPPPEALRFVRLMLLKTELRRLRVLGCEASRSAVTLHLRSDTPLRTENILALVQKKSSPYRVTPDMRLTRKFAQGEVPSGVSAIEKVLDELMPAAA